MSAARVNVRDARQHAERDTRARLVVRLALEPRLQIAFGVVRRVHVEMRTVDKRRLHRHEVRVRQLANERQLQAEVGRVRLLRHFQHRVGVAANLFRFQHAVGERLVRVRLVEFALCELGGARCRRVTFDRLGESGVFTLELGEGGARRSHLGLFLLIGGTAHFELAVVAQIFERALLRAQRFLRLFDFVGERLALGNGRGGGSTMRLGALQRGQLCRKVGAQLAFLRVGLARATIVDKVLGVAKQRVELLGRCLHHGVHARRLRQRRFELGNDGGDFVVRRNHGQLKVLLVRVKVGHNFANRVRRCLFRCHHFWRHWFQR
mmetsp:Transcript_3101/g.4961  ORF Transcript_3101/g.4961 Transcript_3101/m.4961 type:complete len:321 (+) Transcript_3101:1463-2425(+)